MITIYNQFSAINISTSDEKPSSRTIVVVYIDVILIMDNTESEHIANKKVVETLLQARKKTYMRKIYLHTKRDTISLE